MAGITMFMFKEGSRNAYNNERKDKQFRDNYSRLFGLTLPHLDTVIESNQVRIDMAGLVYGVYFLRVYSRDVTDRTGISLSPREVKTFKIVKN